MKIEAFEAYKLNRALRLHFNTEYDGTKYNFKLKDIGGSYDKFKNRRDTFWYSKITKKFEADELKHALVANYIMGSPQGGLHETTFEQNYKKWCGRVAVLEYTFTNDLGMFKTLLGTDVPILSELFTEVGRPWAVIQYEKQKVCLETLVILDRLTGFIVKCGNCDSVIWPKTKRLIQKYSPFLTFDIPKYKQILLEHFPVER